MRPREEAFWAVKRLVEAGLSDYAIARRTGVNRSTVLRWRHRKDPPQGRVIDPEGQDEAPKRTHGRVRLRSLLRNSVAVLETLVGPKY